MLHAVQDVAGIAGALARAEREVGLDSHSVVLRRSKYRFPVDEVLCGPDDGPVAQELRRWRLLVRAFRHYDVIHANWGQGILPVWLGPRTTGPFADLRPSVRRLAFAYLRAVSLRDLRWFKRAGKVLCVTYQGDDARQGDWCRANLDVTFATEVEPDYYTEAGDEAKRAAIAKVGRWADRIYAHNPDLLHVLPAGARFRPYASVDPREWRPVPGGSGDVPVVLHAPTHRKVKGTQLVLDAVDRLRREGVALELVLVEDQPVDEARRLYARADMLVDQLFLGWYGSLAVQLMAMGKPVVSYLRDGDLGFVPAAMRDELPVVRASPSSLYEVLRDLLRRDRPQLAELGARSRRFVERWHDPREIAAAMKRDYEELSLRNRPPAG